MRKALVTILVIVILLALAHLLDLGGMIRDLHGGA